MQRARVPPGPRRVIKSARAESARALGGLRGRGVLLQRAQGVGQQGEKLEGVKSRNNVA